MKESSPSVELIHFANTSYRLGRALNFEAAAMRYKGDPEPNRLFARTYRAPFIVPEKA